MHALGRSSKASGEEKKLEAVRCGSKRKNSVGFRALKKASLNGSALNISEIVTRSSAVIATSRQTAVSAVDGRDLQNAPLRFDSKLVMFYQLS